MAQPTEVLKSLDMLDLSDNEITDAGCATLATALRGGALEELTDLASAQVSFWIPPNFVVLFRKNPPKFRETFES